MFGFARLENGMRKVIGAALVLLLNLCFVPGAVCASVPALAQAEQLRFNGKFKEAVVCLDKAIAVNQKDPALFHSRALSYYLVGVVGGKMAGFSECLHSAIKDCTTEIQMEPMNGDAFALRAQCYQQLNQDDCAIADFNRAIGLTPGDWNTYFNRAAVFSNEHLYESATADCDKALSLVSLKKQTDPLVNTIIYLSRGRIQCARGRYSAGIDDYNKAIVLGTKYNGSVPPIEVSRVYASRGDAKLKLHQYQQAIDDCMKAISLGQQMASPEAFTSLSKAYSEVKRTQKALDALNDGIKLYPNFAEAYYQRARVYRALGKASLSSKDFDTANKLGYVVRKD